MFKNYSKYLLSLALAVLLSSSILTGCAVDNGANPSDNRPAVTAQADLGPTMDIQNRHTDDLMKIDGVVGTGTGLTDNGQPLIYVFTSRADVANIPASLEGVPTQIENVGEVKALAGFKGNYRTPMWSGVSTGNNLECAAGTIGCVVKKNLEGTDHFYLLSNNHVFARQNASVIGEDIVQPGRLEVNCAPGSVVADLSDFVTILFGGQNNTVDAAIAEIRSGITATSQMAINSYTPSNTPANPTVNMAVKKTGRTTGLTSGKIHAVNVTVNVGYSGGTGKFVNQIWIKTARFSNAGDSGSLIVTSSGSAAHPVGLLFAGGGNSTFANPIGNVLTAFGVQIAN